MSEKKHFYGQINYTDLKEALKSGEINAKKIKTQKGEKIVFNINVWVHDTPDKFGQDANIQCQLNKKTVDAGNKNSYYIGNLKYQESKVKDVSQEDLNKEIDEDEEFAY